MKPHIRLKVKKTGLPSFFDMTDEQLEAMALELTKLNKETKPFDRWQGRPPPIPRCPCCIFYG